MTSRWQAGQRSPSRPPRWGPRLIPEGRESPRTVDRPRRLQRAGRGRSGLHRRLSRRASRPAGLGERCGHHVEGPHPGVLHGPAGGLGAAGLERRGDLHVMGLQWAHPFFWDAPHRRRGPSTLNRPTTTVATGSAARTPTTVADPPLEVTAGRAGTAGEGCRARNRRTDRPSCLDGAGSRSRSTSGPDRPRADAPSTHGAELPCFDRSHVSKGIERAATPRGAVRPRRSPARIAAVGRAGGCRCPVRRRSTPAPGAQRHRPR